MAALKTVSIIWFISVALVFRNLRRAGILKNRSLISIMTPGGAPTSSMASSFPPEILTRFPRSSFCGSDVIRIREIKFQNGQKVFRAIADAVNKTLTPSSHTFLDGSQVDENRNPPKTHPSPPVISERSEAYVQTLTPNPRLFQKKLPRQLTETEGPRIIGQLGNMYILCQIEDGLLIVDQHAAHERIVYETLKKSLLSSRIEIQNLLIPHEMEFSLKEKGMLLEKGDVLVRFGIELDHFGGNTFLLRAVPALLKNVNWHTLISEFISKLEEGGRPDDAHITDGAVTLMACHGAIRAGQSLTFTEMSNLINQLKEMDLPTNCPHGRPIFKHFTYFEMSKMFKRIV